MNTILLLALILGVIGIGVFVAFFVKKSQVPRNNLIAFAKSSGLAIIYKNKYSYKLEGLYNSYPFQIEPYFPPVYEKNPKAWTHIQVPMINPNEKFIWLAQGMKGHDWRQAFKPEKAVQVKHELPMEIEILASDLFFSGILLSDQVKAKAKHLFEMETSLLVYLKGETLGVMLPQGPEWQERWKITAASMQFLCEIKDELKRS